MAEVQITMQDIDAGGKAVKAVAFAGQLDETNVDEEAKKIYSVIDQMTAPLLILDFSGLDYMNSKSIGYVTDWYTRASSKGGQIVITSPKPNILDILKVVGITQIINVSSSMEEAKAMFSGGGAPSNSEAPTVAPAAPEAPAPVVPEQPAPMQPAAPAPETPPAPAAPQPAAPAAPPAEAPAAPPAEEKPESDEQIPPPAMPAV